MKKLIFLLTSLALANSIFATTLKIDVATETAPENIRVDWSDGYGIVSREKGYKIFDFNVSKEIENHMGITLNNGKELGLSILKTANDSLVFESQSRYSRCGNYSYEIIYTLTHGKEDFSKWETKRLTLSYKDHERYMIVSPEQFHDLVKGSHHKTKKSILGSYDIKVIVHYSASTWSFLPWCK
ncbi:MULTISPECIES: hypothetical protein [Cysteiniphilum]|uniref:hypothetical protein n=1 Tax=Cysteiniphilum TaxID=2056696 RepID=UPI0017837FC8|nr:MULTISPECIES: hypothetical protein [Cysteiniphilum]